MADELAERRRIDRAARAKAIIDDPLVREGMDAFAADLMSRWLDTRAGDTDVRERIWALRVAGEKVREHLEAVIADGRVSEAILKDMLGGNAA